MKSIEVLLLSRADIVALELTCQQVVDVVTQALTEHAEGSYEMHPKMGVHPTGTDPANFIHAMPAYLHRLNACGLKWVAGFAKNYQRELPNVSGVQVYNDTETGVPLAIMDCGYLTGLRTAAVSAIAARMGARSGAETLALVGCGFEGTMHLRFITHEIPTIGKVRLRDIRPQAMRTLQATAETYFSGQIEICDNDGQCLADADVISTCTNGEDRCIEPQWFKPGAFAVGIEGGCAFTEAALHSADKFVVDDIPLAEYFDKIGRDRLTEDGRPDPEFPGGMPTVYATIGQLVAGKKPARERADERIVATPIGMSICDIALAHLAYHQAIKQGRGQYFSLA